MPLHKKTPPKFGGVKIYQNFNYSVVVVVVVVVVVASSCVAATTTAATTAAAIATVAAAMPPTAAAPAAAPAPAPQLDRPVFRARHKGHPRRRPVRTRRVRACGQEGERVDGALVRTLLRCEQLQRLRFPHVDRRRRSR